MSDTKHIERMRLGDNWIAEILRQDDDSWAITFTDATGAPRPVAVPTLRVEAISSDQIARNLKLRAGAAAHVVLAEGWVEFATHARISIATPGGTLCRSHRFADAPPVLADSGPRGGWLADMGHGAHVEVIGPSGSGWSLVFYEGGTESAAAPANLVTLETIDAAGGVQVFPTQATGTASTLAVDTSGAKPVRLRVAWSHGDHAHRREFDLPQG